MNARAAAARVVRAQTAELDLAGEVALEEIQDDQRPALAKNSATDGWRAASESRMRTKRPITGCWTVCRKPSTMRGKTCSGGWSRSFSASATTRENGRHLFEHGFEQGLLVFEVPVDQGGRLEPGALGDAFDAGAAEAALGHDVDGGVEDLGASAAVARRSAQVAA